MVEFLLELERSGYPGWVTLDLVPKREDAVAACTRSIKNLTHYLKFVERIDIGALKAAQSEMDAMESQRLVQDVFARI